MKTAKEFLADLTAIRTDGSESGVKRCIDYICNELERQNIPFERVKHLQNGKESIVAGVNVETLQNISGGLVLSGHIDTVAADSADWQFPPFELTESKNVLYGRGTVDMKYFAAVLLAELATFKKVSLPIFLVFTSDEETDVCGARAVVSFFKERHIFPNYALIGEPTDFKICVANKGYAGYQMVVKGIAAHSSAPELGVNAVYIAAKLISEIERLNAVYMPLGSTLNVGVVKGGKERNSIAAEASVDWEIRYATEEHREAVLQEMDLLHKRLMTEYSGADIKLSSEETLPAFVEKKDGELTAVLADLLQTDKLSFKYATEAGFFQQAGIETIICGAGDECLAHTANEHIAADDLEKYCRFLRDFVVRVAH